MGADDVLGAFVGGGGLVALVKLASAIIAARAKRSSAVCAMELIARVYDSLGIIVAQTTAVRAMICKVTNGGEIPRLGCDLYASVLYEYSSGLPSIRGTWNRRPIDATHVNLLIECKGSDSVFRTVEELDGDLKDAFVTYGISSTYMIDIRATRGAYYYLAVHYPYVTEDQAPIHRNILRERVSELRRIFESPKISEI